MRRDFSELVPLTFAFLKMAVGTAIRAVTFTVRINLDLSVYGLTVSAVMATANLVGGGASSSHLNISNF